MFLAFETAFAPVTPIALCSTLFVPVNFAVFFAVVVYLASEIEALQTFVALVAVRAVRVQPSTACANYYIN